MLLNKKKTKKKTYPYTEESLNKKEAQLKMLLSLVDVLLLIPVVDIIVVNTNNLKINNTILVLLICMLLFLISYISKITNKRYNFSKWEFLDDEVNIMSDRQLDGEVKDIFINKFVALLLTNILVIIPLSLTFSTILASGISLILSFFLDDMVINIAKFLLITIIFKNFFKPSNEVLIKYLDK